MSKIQKQLILNEHDDVSDRDIHNDKLYYRTILKRHPNVFIIYAYVVVHLESKIVSIITFCGYVLLQYRKKKQFYFLKYGLVMKN